MANASRISINIVSLLILMVTIANVCTAQKTVNSGVRVYHLSLQADQDIIAELTKFVCVNELKSAFIMTCVGSLKHATIRTASLDVKVFDEFLEIVSFVGLLPSSSDFHLHISFGDKNGTVYGGHVFGPLIVRVTVDVVIGEAVEVV